ncbi:hypothetical protein BH23GEM2_BH23GEM2_13240 [soil metagenome]
MWLIVRVAQLVVMLAWRLGNGHFYGEAPEERGTLVAFVPRAGH